MRGDNGSPSPSAGPALLVTVEEAATLLGIGRTSCYELVMAGQLQSIKFGRRRLVVRSEIERFVHRLVQDQLR